MNEKKLEMILKRLDKLEQLEKKLKEMKKEYVVNERAKKIEKELHDMKKWALSMIEDTATLYEINKNNDQEMLTKR